MKLDSLIYVAGHRGLVGSAIVRRLRACGYANLVLRERSELELQDHAEVERFFATVRPQAVFLAAAKVGGIHANNTYPADFIATNLEIQSNVLGAARRHGTQRLLFLGSSCIYPRDCPQPIREEYLLTGKLEPTNEPYAIAKIAGIKLCESYNRQFGTDFRSVMPTNLYGPGDNYHPENSHVIPGLLRRFHEAKLRHAPEVAVWGSGRPRREFLFVDDMADACIHVMALARQLYDSETTPMCSHVNVGTGVDVTIAELAETIARVVGYTGKIVFDPEQPDGTPRKLLDVSRLTRLGWSAHTLLTDGLARTYDAYVAGGGDAEAPARTGPAGNH
jgi:GDP-L-fucose synthase